MKIITVINAKGGCGKSTISISLAASLGLKGHRVLLSDMDPQAQLTDWLGVGDGFAWKGTIIEALLGKAPIDSVIHNPEATGIKNVSFLSSASPLEEYGRNIVGKPDFHTYYANAISEIDSDHFDFLIIDSPNQISPIMENCIWVTDCFIVPFESTKAVKSFANMYALIMRLRDPESFRMMHVLNNISRPGFRKRLIEKLSDEQIPIAQTELRSCGWLAQVDEHGGSIFDYRPHSNGAKDMKDFTKEVLKVVGGIKEIVHG